MEKKKISRKKKYTSAGLAKTISLDLKERMIRVEQTVSAHFHKPSKYYETELFKNMCLKEQQEFEHYLENKKRQKMVMASLIILPFIFLLFLEISPTGNIVKENLGYSISLAAEAIILSIFIVACIRALSLFFSRRRLDKKMKEHLPVITNIIIKKKHVKRRLV